MCKQIQKSQKFSVQKLFPPSLSFLPPSKWFHGVNGGWGKRLVPERSRTGESNRGLVVPECLTRQIGAGGPQPLGHSGCDGWMAEWLCSTRSDLVSQATPGT